MIFGLRHSPLLASLAISVACSSQPSVGDGDDSDRNPPDFTEDDDAEPEIPTPSEPDDGLIDMEPDTDAQPCGNTVIDEGETCDDGNDAGGDGCDEECLLEDGFSCPVTGAPCERATVCGDSRQSGQEQCDDGNAVDGDGCSATCLLEADFACPEPGQACLSTVECGDGRISGPETCDDGNLDEDDGCDQSCATQTGWLCSSPGVPCAPLCGDALITGRETCDDGNDEDGDGCSANCRLESGYTCDAPGQPCRQTECGDGEAEGDEPCDDGDDIHVGDGCSPGCKLEPVCEPAEPLEAEPEQPAPALDAGLDGGTDAGPPPPPGPVAKSGTCSSTCGDGLILAGDAEECDDGNNLAGDGCSAECQIEDGWSCSLVSTELPDELLLPVVYRDFMHRPAEDGTVPRHPDFELFRGNAETPGLVEPILGADGKPVYTGICEDGQTLDRELCPYNEQTTTAENFAEWYVDVDGVNLAIPEQLTFQRQADDTYVFGGGGGMFPLDDLGWLATDPPEELPSNGHNFAFTTELRYWFEFQGGEFLEFQGDDDVWVFIGGQLVVDIGGVHPSRTSSVTLDAATSDRLGLEVGRIYEIALFHAERHTVESNFKLTIGGFVSAETSCETRCGDGIVAGDELCDQGEDNGGGYGFCTEECTPGPRCGDGEVNGEEECDNGVNLSGYQSSTEESPCAPGCVLPPSCGDGQLNSNFGEKCDEGQDNTGAYNGCNEDCSLGPRCGDGIVNGEELCDDGNLSNRDKCDVTCRPIDTVLK